YGLSRPAASDNIRVAQAQPRPIQTPASCRTTQLCLFFSCLGRGAPGSEEFMADSPDSSHPRSTTDAAETVGASRSRDHARPPTLSDIEGCRSQTPSQNNR